MRWRGWARTRWPAQGNSDQGIGTNVMLLCDFHYLEKMAPKLQTHLGSASTKTLRIIDLPSPSLSSRTESSINKDGSTNTSFQTFTSISTQNPLIFQLPDELLVRIVEFAASNDGLQPQNPNFSPTTYNTVAVMILSRVCHRLRRLAQPLLYHDIFRMDWHYKVVPPSVGVCKLHRTLQDRPDLRRYCKSLEMYIPDFGERTVDKDSYLVAENFADWLTKTKRLSINGGFNSRRGSDGNRPVSNERTWSLLRRMAANFKGLEHVTISRQSWGLYLPPILQWINCPNLKVLDIHGISEWKDGPVELERERRGTASFTSLFLSDYEERPQATSLLLQWPAVLTHFQFGSYYNNRHTMDYPMFENMLLIHRNTLKHIDIGYLSSRGDRRLFNATRFPKLEFLKLSRWQMSSPVHFSAEHSNVLGPSLKIFVWDFSIYDQHREAWSSFGPPEAQWVQELAENAISCKAALAKITIHFSPDYYWDSTEEEGYPWDRMDKVRDQTMKPKGLILEYNQPSISKQQWLKYVRTGSLGSDAAEEEQCSAEDKEVLAEELEPAFSGGYHGEDIRGYLNLKA